MPSVVELLGFSDDKAILHSSDHESPPPLSYLKAAVDLTMPSSLSRTNFNLGVQVRMSFTVVILGVSLNTKVLLWSHIGIHVYRVIVHYVMCSRT